MKAGKEDLSKTMFNSIVSYKISNLIMASKIEEICSQLSKECSDAKTSNKLIEFLSNNNRVLVVCDLTLVKSELEELVKVIRTKNCQIFGFYPHVDKDTEIKARSLGVDYVIPRSAMQAKLRSLLV